MAFTGIGLGLRKPHLEAVASMAASLVPFWEIAPENVAGTGGARHRQVMGILEREGILTHGLSMSIGGFDAWSQEVLDTLVAFLKETGTPWHSEHLCWSSFGGAHSHELLPMPFTREAVRHAVARVKTLQARLPVPFLLENISYYAELGEPEMSERDFLLEVLEGAECGWLLDINNVYVNSVNHGFDPKAWLAGMPLHRVAQMHIAGHTWLPEDGLLLATHGEPVIEPVIDLLAWVLPRIGRPVPVLLERDHDIPDLDVLLAERDALQAVYDRALAGMAHA
jgi:uncharacterized protein (UPF0276 family)